MDELRGERVTREEFSGGPRYLLLSGWPKSGDAEIDDAAYTFLLERFSVEEVNEAIRSLMGRSDYLPKAGEIAKVALATRPSPVLAETLTTVSEEVIARRLFMDELDRRESERRDAELDAWAEENKHLIAAGETWLAGHGFPPIHEETF